MAIAMPGRGGEARVAQVVIEGGPPVLARLAARGRPRGDRRPCPACQPDAPGAGQRVDHQCTAEAEQAEAASEHGDHAQRGPRVHALTQEGPG
ncbi:hypothetical protein [Streptomyces mirabilis]|uniref:hypothetical protein n=1 Tax=Streptomyces mirabilis TaxID=68239 RepID=UPI0022572936|nr:hypothetical protein [Streptomyces mirabilis]MCX4419496.1 hypothetical protein [Streptomyces mirabilis]